MEQMFVTGLCFNADSTRIASISDAVLRIWDTETGALVTTFTLPEKDSYFMLFSFSFAGGGAKAICTNHHGLCVYDLDRCTTETSLFGHRSAVTNVSFNADCSLLATGCMDKEARIFDLSGTDDAFSSLSPVPAVQCHGHEN